MKNTIPLIVDLDNTFIKTDLFIESIFVFIKNQPYRIFSLLFWFFSGGLPLLKFNLAEHTPLNLRLLPINSEFCDFLLRQKGKRPIYMFTGSTQKYADAIGKLYPLFDKIIGSSKTVNFTASKKIKKIQELGIEAFEYAGDRRTDIKLFKKSFGAIIVNPSPYMNLRSFVVKDQRIFDRSNFVKAVLKLFSNKVWGYSLGFFLPIIIVDFSRLFTDSVPFAVFVGLGLIGQALFLIHLLFNLEHERQKHPKIRHPAVFGLVGVGETAAIVTLFLVSGFMPLLLINGIWFVITVCGYIFLNLAHSLLTNHSKTTTLAVHCINSIVPIIAGIVFIGESA